MTITDDFVKKLNTPVVTEVSDHTGRYHMEDDGGVEIEVGEFLHGLVRILKPENILETGLYSAISCSYMAQGLRDNGFGHLQSIEFEQKHIERSKKRLDKLGLLKFVTINYQSSEDYVPDRKFEMIFLDSEPWLRFLELVRFLPSLKEGGFVLLHDLPNHMFQMPIEGKDFGWPWGKIPQEIVNLVKDKQLVPIYFPSPRGMTMLYKPTPADYKFL